MLVHVLSYGEKIWLKHEEIETNFQLGIKGLMYIITRQMQDIVGQVGQASLCEPYIACIGISCMFP